MGHNVRILFLREEFSLPVRLESAQQVQKRRQFRYFALLCVLPVIFLLKLRFIWKCEKK